MMFSKDHVQNVRCLFFWVENRNKQITPTYCTDLFHTCSFEKHIDIAWKLHWLGRGTSLKSNFHKLCDAHKQVRSTVHVLFSLNTELATDLVFVALNHCIRRVLIATMAEAIVSLVGCQACEKRLFSQHPRESKHHSSFVSVRDWSFCTGRRTTPVNGAHATHQQANSRVGVAWQFHQRCTTFQAERSVTFNDEDNEAGWFHDRLQCHKSGSGCVSWR